MPDLSWIVHVPSADADLIEVVISAHTDLNGEALLLDLDDDHWQRLAQIAAALRGRAIELRREADDRHWIDTDNEHRRGEWEP